MCSGKPKPKNFKRLPNLRIHLAFEVVQPTSYFGVALDAIDTIQYGLIMKLDVGLLVRH